MLRLVSIAPSDVPAKKLVALFSTDRGFRKVRFGAAGYGDFVAYSRRDPALAARKREAYIRRHGARETWRDPTAPATLSRYILWEYPRLDEAVAAYRRRFGV